MPGLARATIAAAISCDVGQMSFRYTGPSLPMPTGSVARSLSTVPAIAYATTSGGDAEEVRLEVRMDARLEIAVARQHGGADEIVRRDRLVDLGREVAGVADARRAAVGGDGEAELLEIGQQPGLGQVLGDHARARRERRLDVRLDRQALLDRLLREQARSDQHARIRRVGAGGDRGDQYVAVADVDRSRDLRDRVRRRPVVRPSRRHRAGAPFGAGFTGAASGTRAAIVGIVS